MTQIKIRFYKKTSKIFDKLADWNLELDRIYNKVRYNHEGFTKGSLFYSLFKRFNSLSFKMGYRAFKLKGEI